MKKNEIAFCQEYRGYADMESVEYKYPLKKALKYVGATDKPCGTGCRRLL